MMLASMAEREQARTLQGCKVNKTSNSIQILKNNFVKLANIYFHFISPSLFLAFADTFKIFFCFIWFFKSILYLCTEKN